MTISQDLGIEMQRELAAWKDADAVPWRFLMRLCAALRQRGAWSCEHSFLRQNLISPHRTALVFNPFQTSHANHRRDTTQVPSARSRATRRGCTSSPPAASSSSPLHSGAAPESDPQRALLSPASLLPVQEHRLNACATSASPRRTVDPAHEERFAELRIQAQEREYQSLVADLTRKERDEKERVRTRLPFAPPTLPFCASHASRPSPASPPLCSSARHGADHPFLPCAPKTRRLASVRP